MTKSKERIKKNGEVFTPAWLVNDMLNKLPQEVWENPDLKWLEPAAGDGNFVARIVERRLECGHDPEQILKTLFAVELMEDNVEKMINRVLDIVGHSKENEELARKNLKQGNFLEIDDFEDFFGGL